MRFSVNVNTCVELVQNNFQQISPLLIRRRYKLLAPVTDILPWQSHGYLTLISKLSHTLSALPVKVLPLLSANKAMACECVSSIHQERISLKAVLIASALLRRYDPFPGSPKEIPACSIRSNAQQVIRIFIGSRKDHRKACHSAKPHSLRLLHPDFHLLWCQAQPPYPSSPFLFFLRRSLSALSFLGSIRYSASTFCIKPDPSPVVLGQSSKTRLCTSQFPCRQSGCVSRKYLCPSSIEDPYPVSSFSLQLYCTCYDGQRDRGLRARPYPVKMRQRPLPAVVPYK